MTCPSCSAEVPEGARFCPACAAPLGSAGAGALSDPDAPTALAPEGGPTPASSTSRLSSAPTLDGSRFMPGTLLAERYRIVGVLGRGGMGEVYRADDLKLGQSVALKFLPEAVEKDREWLDRFLNEVKIARQISNPNVCRVYDVGEVDGHHFLSMEYIDGEDLGSLLRRIGRLPGDKAVQIARQLCAGLAAAHDQGVLHRDLKPANVMIDGRGNARLTDFGLAGLGEGLAAGDVSSGTPAYMAPEQLEGREVTVRSDLYALGLVLYQLFTGKRAFKADSVAELSRLHRESEPTSPTELVDGLDPAVERVILRCLEKEPGNRPGSALEVSAALPGGDPLAAALAAGETPSPEMVAAAGEEGVLEPRRALGLLVGFAALTAVFVGLAGRNLAVAHMPLDLPGDVLVHKAREMLERLGADSENVADSAWAFRFDSDFLRHFRTDWEEGANRWETVRRGRPALLEFWYRQSPRNLLPLRNSPTVVSWTEPPHESSGMASIRLDMEGRLLDYLRVPPQLEEAPEEGAEEAGPVAEPDWAALFEAADLEMAAFTPVPSTWVPEVYADRRAAWTGELPDLEGTAVRVEAAAYRGHPVYFQLIGPWSRASRQVAVERTASSRVNNVIFVSLLLIVVVTALLMCRRNLRAVRGDPTGATRMALAILLVNIVSSLLLSHHPGTFLGQLGLFVFSLGLMLFFSALAWVLYVALEPYLRRHHPHWLVSWSRLLAGRFRDPLVGRDVLVGAVVGAALAALSMLSVALGRWLEPALVLPATGSIRPMLGLPEAVGWLLSGVQGGTFAAMFFIFLWFLLRQTVSTVGAGLGRLGKSRVEGRGGTGARWQSRLTGGILLGLLTLNVSAQGGFSWTGLATALLIALLLVLATARFGLVTLITGIVFGSGISNAPITFDLGAWWSHGSWLCVLILVAVAVWAFRTALGGRPLLPEP